jgi:hypothetical protein
MKRRNQRRRALREGREKVLCILRGARCHNHFRTYCIRSTKCVRWQGDRCASADGGFRTYNATNRIPRNASYRHTLPLWRWPLAASRG